MQGLAIRLARSLNRLAGRTGKVFSDRFHSLVLKTLREVANAIRYVLENFRHHLREDVGPEGVGGTTGPAQARRSAPLEHGSCERPAASPEALRGRLLGSSPA